MCDLGLKSGHALDKNIPTPAKKHIFRGVSAQDCKWACLLLCRKERGYYVGKKTKWNFPICDDHAAVCGVGFCR